MKLTATMLASAILFQFTISAVAADWPQWQGPERNGISKETGLLQEWPKDGPPLAWKTKGLGGGYSGPSISAGRIFGMSFRGGDEVVWALTESDGKEQWSAVIGPAAKGREIGAPGNEGPRCTPTVDGDLVYALGATGQLVCLKVDDGKEVWHTNFKKDFSGRFMHSWGYCESPLIDGDKLICTPGGSEATTVALDKRTGDLIWKSQVSKGNGAGYASPIVIQAAGHKQYVHFLEGGLAGIDAESGKVLWQSSKCANGTANCATPIFADDCVFASSAYPGGSGALVKLSKDGSDGIKADLIYSNRNLKNHHGGVILHDGYLYGASGGNEGGNLVCIDFKTGEIKWTERSSDRAPKGGIAMADGRLYYRHEHGTMTLLEPSPKEYIEDGRFDPPDRSRANAWTHPVIANGKLYLRDQDVLLCYDIKAK
jgi:outer membrane protein assembly factor BamB